MNIADAMEMFIYDLKKTHSEETARSYKNAINHLALHLTEWDLSPSDDVNKITPQHLVDFYPYLNSLGLAQGSRRVYSAGLAAFIDWLILYNYAQFTYSDMLRVSKAARKATAKRGKRFPRTPNKGSVEKIMAIVDNLNGDSPIIERNIAIIHFLHSSGCRAGELVSLTINDLDLGERSAVVTGKGNKDRRVFIDTETVEALKLYFAARDAWAKTKHAKPETPVFCRHDRGAGKKAKKISTFTVRKIVSTIAVIANLDENFTPHSFRHAFAITMLRKTRDISLVQRLLGHEDPATTTIYAEIYPDELMEAHREVWE